MRYRIPLANTLDEIALGKNLTDDLLIPGFVMPPEVISEAIGRSIFEITELMDELGSGQVTDEIIGALSPIIDNVFGISTSGPRSSLSISVSNSFDNNSHIDPGYEGGVFHLSGRMPEPRIVELATIYGTMSHRNLPLAASLPFSAKDSMIYEGSVEEGWGVYMLAKDRSSEARTAHRFVGAGAYARFGDKDQRLVEVHRWADESLEKVRRIIDGEDREFEEFMEGL